MSLPVPAPDSRRDGARCFGIALGLSHPSEGRQTLSRLEISGGLGQLLEDFPRGGIATIQALLPALGVGRRDPAIKPLSE